MNLEPTSTPSDVGTTAACLFTFTKVGLITFISHFLGTAVFALIMDWPDLTVLIFSPLMALAGWLIFVLMVPLVIIMWVVCAAGVIRSNWLFILTGAAIGSLTGAMLAAGPELRWRIATSVAGLVSGAISTSMILLFHKLRIPSRHKLMLLPGRANEKDRKLAGSELILNYDNYTVTRGPLRPSRWCDRPHSCYRDIRSPAEGK